MADYTVQDTVTRCGRQFDCKSIRDWYGEVEREGNVCSERDEGLEHESYGDN
jgi:hypothetical protein